MTVYVDNMLRPATVPGARPAKWSHLLADSHEELEAFARDLGLRPSWIQKPGTAIEHYDVTSTVRERALRLGAVPMQYGREGGLFTMWKAAMRNGAAPEEIAKRRQLFEAEHARNCPARPVQEEIPGA